MLKALSLSVKFFGFFHYVVIPKSIRSIRLAGGSASWALHAHGRADEDGRSRSSLPQRSAESILLTCDGGPRRGAAMARGRG